VCNDSGALSEKHLSARPEPKDSLKSPQSLLHLASAFLPKLGPFLCALFARRVAQIGGNDSVGNIRKELWVLRERSRTPKRFKSVEIRREAR
jgi:hypothetical protein